MTVGVEKETLWHRFVQAALALPTGKVCNLGCSPLGGSAGKSERDLQVILGFRGLLVVHLRKNGWAHHSLRPALYPSRSQPPGDFQVKSKVLELQFSSQVIPLALHLGAKRNPALKASTAAEKVGVIHAGDCHKLS